MSEPNSVSGGLTRPVVVVALLAIVFGRALANAVPGSRAGLGRILDANRIVAGFSSQLLAVLLVLVIGRLAVGLWQEARLPITLRLVVAPAAMLVTMLLIAASLDELISPYTPEISLLLGLAGTLVAVNAVRSSLTPSRLRASGLTLLLVVTASGAQITARLLALQASGAALPRQFAVARWLATCATALDAVALLLVAAWLMHLWKKGSISMPVAVGLAGFLSYLSRSGSRSGATLAAVLLSRSLAQLHREPSSMFPLWLQDGQELFSLLIAAILIVQPKRAPLEQRVSVALLLLARCSPDIPLCSGLLVAGALGLLRLSIADATDPTLAPGEYQVARAEANLR